MFETLIESQRKPDKKRVLEVGFVSLTIHTALIAAAIIATVKVGQSDTLVLTDTTLVILENWNPRKQQVKVDDLLKDIGEVKMPTIRCVFPWITPPEGFHETFPYPKDPRGGVESDVANNADSTGELYVESLVDVKPSLLSATPPPYPELLHQAGIGGQVLLQAILDTSGRAEPHSVRIVHSPHPAFDPGSRNWILHAVFRPARVRGHAVRVLIQVPLDYRITGR